jgi:hypothetical protein
VKGGSIQAKYSNPWIPADALCILHEAKGPILDVGGGGAPYYGSAHIVDIQPFSGERLGSNAWGYPDDGNRQAIQWSEKQYTQLDVCDCRRWPFDDRQYEIGLCSHCIEDVRDPSHAVRELSRVCSRVLIIAPSRLLEQTMGVEHPRYCGFHNHQWIISSDKDTIVFRRKSPIVNLRGCHIRCPYGMTLKREYGAAFHLGTGFHARECAFWSEKDDFNDYRQFILPYLGRQDIFESDGRTHDIRTMVWYLKRRFLSTL